MFKKLIGVNDAEQWSEPTAQLAIMFVKLHQPTSAPVSLEALDGTDGGQLILATAETEIGIDIAVALLGGFADMHGAWEDMAETYAQDLLRLPEGCLTPDERKTVEAALEAIHSWDMKDAAATA